MRNLLRYIVKHYAFLLFLILEIISVTLIINNNRYAKAKFLNSSNAYVGFIYKNTNEVSEYFKLRAINKKLSKENAELKSFVLNRKHYVFQKEFANVDTTLHDSIYHLIPAKVINNSTNKPFNYITLNKGTKDGIKIDQGVICGDGIVGVVVDASSSYALVMSVLNPRWNISAKIKKNDYFGSLSWSGNNHKIAELKEIPFHVSIEKGDSITTSAYSSIFPKGILVGTISDYKNIEGDNYLFIKVALSTDFKSLSYVQVVDFLEKEEIKSLEKQYNNYE